MPSSRVLRLLRGRLRSEDAGRLLERLRTDVVPGSTGIEGLELSLVGLRDDGDRLGMIALSAWRDEDAIGRADGTRHPSRLFASLSAFVMFDDPLGFELLPGPAPSDVARTGTIGLVVARTSAADEPAMLSLIERSERDLRADGLARGMLIGRREERGSIELAVVALWPDRDAVATFLAEREAGPGIDPHFTALASRLRFEVFDVVDPREPPAAQPPGHVPAVLVLDDDRRIVDASPGTQPLLGMPPESLLGRRLDDLVPPAERPELERGWAAFLAEGRSTGVRLTRRANGRELPLRHRYVAHLPAPGLHAALLEPTATAGAVDVEATVRHALGDWRPTPALLRSQSPARTRRPSLVTLPSEDRLFQRFAGAALDALGTPSMRRLQLHLRGLYPRAVVHRRNLAGEEREVWYVFRDGRVAQPSVPAGWWRAPGVASGIVARDGRIVAADEACGVLLGVAHGSLDGRDARTFGVTGSFDDLALLLALAFDLRTVDSSLRLIGRSREPVDVALHLEAEGDRLHVAAIRLPDEEPGAEWFAPLCLPPRDHRFIARVEDLCARLVPAEPAEVAAELEVRLRVSYPAATVRPLGRLTGFGAGTEVLLVYRDGEPDEGDRWWEDRAVAHVRIEDGRYVEADEAAAALYGVARDELIGSRVGRFTGAGEEDMLLRDILHRTGSLHTTGRLLRGDGREIEVEFYARPLRSEGEGAAVALREVSPVSGSAHRASVPGAESTSRTTAG